MAVTESIIECVPNFSEGRDLARIDALAAAIAGAPGVLVLDRTSDPDHNRSVITFAGRPQYMVEAAVRAAAEAMRSIDLRVHQGVHPRVGALDVLPFVPLGSATLEHCVALAHEAGERLAGELGLPVYFYGAAAGRPERVALENLRRGQFEGLREEASRDPARAPDLGGPALHPSAGAALVGARHILIAFNIDLATTDLTLARHIARTIRASSGGFPAVKALGLPLPSRRLVQVSMNLTDYRQTPLHVVFNEVQRLAAAAGVAVAGSELIGLLPQDAALSAFAHWSKLPGFSSRSLIEEQLRLLTFSTFLPVGPFLPGEKIC